MTLLNLLIGTSSRNAWFGLHKKDGFVGAGTTAPTLPFYRFNVFSFKKICNKIGSCTSGPAALHLRPKISGSTIGM